MTMTTMDQPALARRPAYQPLAPIGSATGLKGLLEMQKGSLSDMLPKHVTPERLLKTMLVAANRNPDILKCTQASVLETINRAAELGLDLSGTLGEAYPVPFNNKVKWTDDQGRPREDWKMQCQLIIGYRGMEKLAWQSGEVESIDAEVVYEKDKFVFRKGTEVHVEWTPHFGPDRGEVIGAYACIKLKSGGKLARFLTAGDIDKIRNASKSKDSPAWKNWWSEMARKCALKRTLKDAPLSTEKFVAAMEHDNSDVDVLDVLSADTGAGRPRARLNDRITSKPVSEDQTFVEDPDAQQNIAAQDAHVGESAADPDQHGGEPDVTGADAQPPTDATDVSTWAATLDSLEAAAQDAGLSPSDLSTRVNLWTLAAGAKGKEEKKTTPDQRLSLVQAVRNGKLGADGKIIP